MILRIKEIRESGKISQTALAEKLHVNQTAVSQWERGVAYPTCDRLPEIAKALGPATAGGERRGNFLREPAQQAGALCGSPLSLTLCTKAFTRAAGIWLL